MFFGGSFTQKGGGPGGWWTIVNQELRATLPQLNIQLFNAGRAGDLMPDLQQRINNVRGNMPGLVVMLVGDSDTSGDAGKPGVPIGQFEAGLRVLVDRTAYRDANILLCTPPFPAGKYDDTPGFNERFEAYCDVIRQVAAETGCQLLDLRRAFIARERKGAAAEKHPAPLTEDGSNLNDAGQMFVAEQMLKALGVR